VDITETDPDPGRYCRDIETYLCRKNDGHLIRIVGPAFELVTGWAHIERTIAALTARRAGAGRELDRALDATVRQLDALRAAGKAPRGEARAHVLETLRTIDERLMSDVRALVSAAEMQTVEQEAEESLAPFRSRMPAAAWMTARTAAMDRALRARLQLPVISFE
jgi:hypothetical protein